MTAWRRRPRPRPREKTAAARLDDAYAAWDEAITVIGDARKKQMAAPACRSPRRRRSPPWTANGTG